MEQHQYVPRLIYSFHTVLIHRPLGYERVYLPLYKVADTPFHIQRDDIIHVHQSSNIFEYMLASIIINI